MLAADWRPEAGLRQLVTQRDIETSELKLALGLRHRMNLRLNSTLAMAALLLNSGCATIAWRGQDHENRLYPATTLDVGLFKDPNALYIGPDENRPPPTPWAPGNYLFRLMCIIDLPFSIVSDTILLPLDTILIHNDKRRDKSKEQQP